MSTPHNQRAIQPARSGVQPLARGSLLQRECACGEHRMAGGECEACSKKKVSGVQTKLNVSEPGDVYEQEADRVANQVMTSPSDSAVTGAMPRIQRVASHPSEGMNAAPAGVDRVLAGPSTPLGPSLRSDMEQRFGYDFSRVRIHFGAAAEQSAREVNAKAYTVGQDIVFGTGQFAPHTREGRRLIAHELTHVVQQSGPSSNGMMQRSPANETADDYEKKVIGKTWCRDSGKSGALHDPNLQCYREIPPKEGYTEAGQVCFDKETGKFVESSPDYISAVSGIKDDGTCDIPLSITDPPNPFFKRGRRALGHGIADICGEDPEMCGTAFGALSGVAMGIALPKDDGITFGTFAIPTILGSLAGYLTRRGLPKLDRLARRHGFLPTISLGFGSNVGAALGMGFEKRDRPLPVVPVNTYLTFSFDSSLASRDESSFLAKVGIRIDPGKQGGIFALSSLGAGLAIGDKNVSGALSADVGLGIRPIDFLDVQVVHETLIGGEKGGGTYWVTLKLVAPQRVLKGH